MVEIVWREQRGSLAGIKKDRGGEMERRVGARRDEDLLGGHKRAVPVAQVRSDRFAALRQPRIGAVQVCRRIPCHRRDRVRDRRRGRV